MLLVQELRSRFEQKWTPFNLGDQACGTLVTLKYVGVVGKIVDVGQSGALEEEVTYCNFIAPIDSWGKLTHMRIEAQRSLLYKPQDRRRRELHRHRRDVEPCSFLI